MMILVQLKAIILTLFVLVFGLMPASLIALPFPLRRRLKIVGPVWRRCSQFILRSVCQAHLTIKEDHRSEHFKGTPSWGLYVANHQSFLDIPTIVSTYIAPPIMKKEVLYIPLFGLLARASGALPVSRRSLKSRQQVFEQAKHRVLKEKIGVQVYPEGTRSLDSYPKEYDKIKKALLLFAFKEKIPVIPTSLYGTRGVISSRGVICPGRHIGIIVHQEILPQDFTSSDEFARAIWSKVREGHDDLKERLGPMNRN